MARARTSQTRTSQIGLTVMDERREVATKKKSSWHYEWSKDFRDGKKKDRWMWTPFAWFLGTNGGQWTALFIVAVFLVLVGSLAWSAIGGNEENAGPDFQESVWQSWGLFFDPGTQTGVPPDDRSAVKIVAVLLSVGGYMFNLTFLGLVVERVRNFLSEDRALRNRIVTNDHYLILGWSGKTLFLLNELLVAHEKERGALTTNCCCCRRRRGVVILAKTPTLEMIEESQAHLKHYGRKANTITFREGDPSNQRELEKVSASSAYKIFITGQQGCDLGSDQEVIQILLAIAALPESPSCDVLAEMRTQESVEVTHQLLPKGMGIIARHPVNRMLCLRALHPNVGFCYMDLVSFAHGDDGHELYLTPVHPDLQGLPFFECQYLFADAVIMGLKPAPELSTGRRKGGFNLLPERSRELREDDQFVVLAQSRTAAGSRCRPSNALPTQDTSGITRRSLTTVDGRVPLSPFGIDRKDILIVGCPNDIADFLHIIDGYVAPQTIVTLFSQRSLEWRDAAIRQYSTALRSAPGKKEFANITLKHEIGSPTCKRHLHRLPLEELDCIIILSEHEENIADLGADSRSLTTVMIIRDLMALNLKTKKDCKIVTELLDSKSEHVVRDNDTIRKHGKYFYSNSFETGVFATAAWEKSIYNIIVRLLLPEDNAGEIAAIPASELVFGQEDLSFFDLHARVVEAYMGILIGWRIEGKRYPVLNPKDKMVKLHWTDGKDTADGTQTEFLILRPSATPVAAEVAVSGVDFDKIISHEQLTNSFKEALQAAIKKEFEGKVANVDMDMAISKESIVAKITLLPPAHVGASQFQGQLRDNLAELVARIEGFSDCNYDGMSVLIKVLEVFDRDTLRLTASETSLGTTSTITSALSGFTR